MSLADGKRLIVGLGNPGEAYALTRHNLGFMVVEAMARRFGLHWKRGWRVKGRVALGVARHRSLCLLQPLTFMNCSGSAVATAMRLYGIEPKRLMVIVDDVALPFGTSRVRHQGSSGGHKGLASIEEHLKSQEFSRLRLGVGNALLGQIPLEKFVLDRFTADEQAQMSSVIEDAVASLEQWLDFTE